MTPQPGCPCSICNKDFETNRIQIPVSVNDSSQKPCRFWNHTWKFHSWVGDSDRMRYTCFRCGKGKVR